VPNGTKYLILSAKLVHWCSRDVLTLLATRNLYFRNYFRRYAARTLSFRAPSCPLAFRTGGARDPVVIWLRRLWIIIIWNIPGALGTEVSCNHDDSTESMGEPVNEEVTMICDMSNSVTGDHSRGTKCHQW